MMRNRRCSNTLSGSCGQAQTPYVDPSQNICGVNTPNPTRPARQLHTHEFQGSTFATGACAAHRFAGVSSEAIVLPDGGHVHTVCSNTTYNGHFHVLELQTSRAIETCDGQHVHFIRGEASVNEGHSHIVQAATMISAECE